MFLIKESRWLAPKVKLLIVDAPRVAKHHQAGHFVIIRTHTEGERIPLTVARADKHNGTITLVVQAIGASTERITQLKEGEHLLDVAGPLGRATEIEDFKHVVLVGGGVGTAVIYPQSIAFKEKGSKVSAIIGGRSKPYVILENELAGICDCVYPCTDDGSYGFHGFVTNKLEKLLLDSASGIDAVFTAGPVLMMKAIAEVTRRFGVKTIASLNPIMVDGTGMCGGCRVTVGGEQKFACVDGPEFDAHKVDFSELAHRLTSYKAHEVLALDRQKQKRDHKCNLRLPDLLLK